MNVNLWLRRHNHFLRIALKAAVLYGFFCAVLLLSIDPDFGWHLRAGQYTLEHGLPQYDLFTYTAPSFHWINHEWGSDVLLALLHSFGGYSLLMLFFAALWTAAVLIPNHKASLVALLMGSIAIVPYVGIREFTWTLLCFSISLVLLRSKKPHALYLLIPLVLLWANLHGGFIVGLALIGYFAIRERSLRHIFVLALAFAVTLLNPYGIRIYEELLRTLTDTSLKYSIEEWHMLDFEVPTAVYICIWAAIYIVAEKFHWKRLFGLGPILLAAGASATRNIPFFVVYTLSDLDSLHTQLVGMIPKSRTAVRHTVTWALIVLGLGASVVGLAISLYVPQEGRGGYPDATLRYLQQHPCEGNLFAGYNYGGYLIWKLPDQKLYIDGRMPSWTDENGESYLKRYFAIYKSSEARQREFTRYGISCVLVSVDASDSQLVKDLRKEGWKTVSRDSSTQLLLSP